MKKYFFIQMFYLRKILLCSFLLLRFNLTFANIKFNHSAYVLRALCTWLILNWFFPLSSSWRQQEGNFETTSLKESRAVNRKDTVKSPFPCLSSWQMDEAFTGEACCDCWQAGSRLDSAIFHGPEFITFMCFFPLL